MAGGTARYITDSTRSVAVGNLDELLITVWADRAVDDTVYKNYLNALITLAEKIPPIVAQLIVSPSFSPNLRQRGMLKESEIALRMEAQRAFVVVSDTPAVRSAVNTMAWMFPKKWALKSLPAAQLADAASFLKAQGVRASEAAIVACVDQLRGLLAKPGLPTLDET